MFWWKQFLRRWLPAYLIDVDEEDDVLEYDERGNPVQMRPRVAPPTRATRRSVNAHAWRATTARRAVRRALLLRRPTRPARACSRAARQPHRVVRITRPAVATAVSGAGDGPPPPPRPTRIISPAAEVIRG